MSIYYETKKNKFYFLELKTRKNAIRPAICLRHCLANVNVRKIN